MSQPWPAPGGNVEPKSADRGSAAYESTQEMPLRVPSTGHPTAVLPAVPGGPPPQSPGTGASSASAPDARATGARGTAPGSATAPVYAAAPVYTAAPVYVAAPAYVAAPVPSTVPTENSVPAQSSETAQNAEPAHTSVVRRGAGLPGFLAVAALAGLGLSLFALPLQGHRAPVFFSDLRAAAARSAPPGGDSLAGRSVATLWWRYGALAGFAVLALLVALMVSAPVVRRASAVLLMLAALAVGALMGYAGYQTADLAKQQARSRFVRESAFHFQLGFWLALGCCVVLFLVALVAASQPSKSRPSA